MVSCRLRKRRRDCSSEVGPSTAFFASWSTSSLPTMPSCPAVQYSIIGRCLRPLHLDRIFPCLWISRTLCAGLLSSVLKFTPICDIHVIVLFGFSRHSNLRKETTKRYLHVTIFTDLLGVPTVGVSSRFGGHFDFFCANRFKVIS